MIQSAFNIYPNYNCLSKILCINALNLFTENTDENRIFFVRSPQAFWQSSAPGALNTLMTSAVLYSLTRATLMSPGKDETRVCGYIYIYIYICVCVCVCLCLCVCRKKTKEMGWAQRLPLFCYLRNGRYKKVYGSIRNWETLIDLHWRLLWGNWDAFHLL